ncbi:MAG: adenylate/guanylate cyclase domain-containing protein [Stellaceae bacterium]
MGERKVERRLAAILAADVVGYSRLVGEDEEGTLERLRVLRRTLADPKIKEHHGRVVRTMGDGLLVEFASVVDAVRCAVEVQREMALRNADLQADRRIEFRIGINLGDIIKDGREIYGDGVNVAARLEALASPGGICVSRVVRDQVCDKLGFAFDDRGEQQVKNIARPVRVFDVNMTGETMPLTPDAAARAPLSLPDRPSIAVLPFQNMSGDPEQEYFADGMVEEIITALSRIRWLFVIARNSSFTYKGRSVGVKQVGRELGVRYVLEGSVRKGGNRVRITAQLIEAETGTHLWADRFDGSLEDVFDLQDRVAINVAGVIEPALQAAEVHRSAARPTSDATAYDLYLRALATYYPITKERLLRALDLLHQAIATDRHWGPALSLAAMCHMRRFREGWAEESETASEAVDLARQALQVAGDDPGILANAAFVLANFGEDIGAMIALVDRALTLTPSFSRGWFLSGVLRLWAGQHDLAIEHAETALRLSPRERTGTPLSLIGEAHFFKREFDEAASKLLLSVQENPGYPHSYCVLAACYFHMGRLDEAHAIIARLRSITPRLVPSAAQLRSPADRELFLSGLRVAVGEAA